MKKVCLMEYRMANCRGNLILINAAACKILAAACAITQDEMHSSICVKSVVIPGLLLVKNVIIQSFANNRKS
jgi:hypothetical protein